VLIGILFVCACLGILCGPWLLRWRFVQFIDKQRLKLFLRQDGSGFGTGTGIHFVSGVPGGGKSLWVMCEYIAAELLEGRRIVATNFKFGNKLGAMRSWMAKHGIPDYRLQILEDEEVRGFYFKRYRVGGRSGICIPYLWKDLSSGEWKAGRLPRWQVKTGDPGILYVLEETANLFRAKEWQQFPASATFYLSQHRKSGDGVIVLTQDVDLISLDFRRLAQDFTYLQNYGQTPFRGINLGRRFEARVYLSPVTRGSNKGTPVRVKLFTLNPTLANLYATDAGVGFNGRGGADSKWKPKGVPLWVPVTAIFALAFGGWYLVNHGTGWVARSVTKKTYGAVEALKPGVSTNLSTSSGASVDPTRLPPAASHRTKSISLTGYVRNTDGTGLFMLSDGRVLNNPDADFDGQILKLKNGLRYERQLQ